MSCRGCVVVVVVCGGMEEVEEVRFESQSKRRRWKVEVVWCCRRGKGRRLQGTITRQALVEVEKAFTNYVEFYYCRNGLPVNLLFIQARC